MPGDRKKLQLHQHKANMQFGTKYKLNSFISYKRIFKEMQDKSQQCSPQAALVGVSGRHPLALLADTIRVHLQDTVL